MRFEDIPTWDLWKSSSSSFLTIRANKPKLVRIDDLIKKYPQVLGPSKLNILMELKNAVIDWAADKIDRDAVTGRLPAMKALEEVVTRKLNELDGWGDHQYLNVVCIGFAAQLPPYSEAARPAGFTVEQRAQQRRVNELLDIDATCQKLIGGITGAYRLYQAYKARKKITPEVDATILKIFMAPEFFFRGPYGAYCDIGWMSDILTKIRVEINNAKYSDWLFVNGTAIFTSEKMSGEENEVNVSKGRLLENYAIVQRGSLKTSEHHDVLIAKEFPSHIDFRHQHDNPLDWYNPDVSSAIIANRSAKHLSPEGGRVDPAARGMDDLDARTASVSELVGGSIFTMNGITFGLEVCRDHLIGRLAHSSEGGKVQIQLIPSWGAWIERQSLACVPGGIVFNVDGSKGTSDLLVRSGAGVNYRPVDYGGSDDQWITLYAMQKIPWPGRVRADVAMGLGLSRDRLSGTGYV